MSEKAIGASRRCLYTIGPRAGFHWPEYNNAVLRADKGLSPAPQAELRSSGVLVFSFSPLLNPESYEGAFAVGRSVDRVDQWLNLVTFFAGVG